jgi:hypothetical protein
MEQRAKLVGVAPPIAWCGEASRIGQLPGYRCGRILRAEEIKQLVGWPNLLFELIQSPPEVCCSSSGIQGDAGSISWLIVW